MADPKKIAVFIGNDRYDDKDIKNLSGAINDANEMAARLETANNFEVIHRVPDGNTQQMRKAISDLLWAHEPAQVALLYFSGHGIVDTFNKGYLAPSNMIADEPYVHGISLAELRGLVNDSKHDNVILFLDCCYSGVITDAKATRGIATNKIREALDGTFGEMPTGKFIFASSDGEQVSIERKYKDKVHGVFTSYLLSGLDGGAESDRGVINLQDLWQFVGDGMREDKNVQTPKALMTDVSLMHEIQICRLPDEIKDYLNDKFVEITNQINQQLYWFAAESLNEVLGAHSSNADAEKLENEIIEKFNLARTDGLAWLEMSVADVSPAVYKAVSELLGPEYSLEMIAELERLHKQLIAQLFIHSGGNARKFGEMCHRFLSQPGRGGPGRSGLPPK